MTSPGRATCCVVGLLAATTLGAQVRDVTVAPRTGTAVVTGRIIDDRGEPVRRANVRIESGGITYGTSVTDADARFALTDLPAGTFILSASKAGYVSTAYGSRRPGRPGTSLVLTNGARVNDVVLTLARGAVITGRVVDPSGEPVPGLQIRLLRSRFAAGGRALVPVPVTPAAGQTDDRGVYRVFGLEPGDYVIGTVPPRINGTTRLITQADFDRATREGQAPSGAGRIGTAGARGAGSPSAAPEPVLVSYVPVYYPGVTSLSAAAIMSLGIGEERRDADFRLEFVPTVRVTGRVVRSDGQPLTGVRVLMMPNSAGISVAGGILTATPGADGAFTFPSTVPGDYIAAAMTSSGLVFINGGGVTRSVNFAVSGAADADRLSAQMALAPVSVGVAGLDGLTLAVSAGVSLTGNVVFDGASTSNRNAAGFTVSLTPRVDFSQASRPARGTADASGAFMVNAILPGKYLVSVNAPARPDATGWMLASVLINGREVVDSGLEVTGGESQLDASVTLTDRAASVRGVFQNASGQPATDFTVVLFAADRSLWRWESRYIKAVRPQSNGSYAFSDLPPGSYLLTAVTDIETYEWFDPQLLDTLVPAAIKLTLGNGERQVQDIRTR